MKTILVVLLLGFGIASCDAPNGCEEAKASIEQQIADICTETAYAETPFCVCCVQNGLYSVADDCTCRGITFDTDACYYSKGEQAAPRARAAVEFAAGVCASRKPVVPLADAGSALCVSNTQAGSSGASTASSSSSASSSAGGNGNGGSGGGGGSGGAGP